MTVELSALNYKKLKVELQGWVSNAQAQALVNDTTALQNLSKCLKKITIIRISDQPTCEDYTRIIPLLLARSAALKLGWSPEDKGLTSAVNMETMIQRLKFYIDDLFAAQDDETNTSFLDFLSQAHRIVFIRLRLLVDACQTDTTNELKLALYQELIDLVATLNSTKSSDGQVAQIILE